MPTPPRRAPHGFTLVELLVTIAIVAVLVTLAFVGFRRARAAGDRAATVSVMRQLQMANFAYADDHAGRFVPIQTRDENNANLNAWHQNSVYLAYLTGDSSALDRGSPTANAPLSVLDPVVVRAKKRLWDRLFASYGYNENQMPFNDNADGKTRDKCFLVNQLSNPARTAAFVTATDFVLKYTGRLLWETAPVEGKSTDGKMAFRHSNQAIVVYYDGHSGFVTIQDIKRIDTKGGASHPFWKANF